MEFSKPEYWSGYLFPSPGDLPNPGVKPRSPTLQADSISAESPEKPKGSYQALQFKNINSSVLSLLYGPTLISVHDHWKNHTSDYMDFCQQRDVFAF